DDRDRFGTTSRGFPNGGRLAANLRKQQPIRRQFDNVRARCLRLSLLVGKSLSTPPFGTLIPRRNNKWRLSCNHIDDRFRDTANGDWLEQKTGCPGVACSHHVARGA